MSSSKEKPFSASELQALGLWDVAAQFGKKKGTVRPAVKEEKTSLTVDEIEKIQKQARDEAFEQGKESGYEVGFQEGKAAGHEAGFEQGKLDGEKKGYEENLHLLRKQTAEFVSLLEALNEPFKVLDEKIEKELVDLAIGIATQVVRREIKIDPEHIIVVIREAVNALPIAEQKITLHMHSEDAELVRSSLALDDISPPWIIIEDPLVTRGGCRVATETSNIDSTVENRLAIIVATVLGGERQKDDEQ